MTKTEKAAIIYEEIRDYLDKDYIIWEDIVLKSIEKSLDIIEEKK